MRYKVMCWNVITWEWSYYNTFNNYKDAADARDEYTRRYGGRFEVFEA